MQAPPIGALASAPNRGACKRSPAIKKGRLAKCPQWAALTAPLASGASMMMMMLEMMMELMMDMMLMRRRRRRMMMMMMSAACKRRPTSPF